MTSQAVAASTTAAPDTVTPSKLLLLPDEVIVAIVSYLDMKDVTNLGFVNKKMRELCCARLFHKIRMEVPEMEAGYSLRECIQSNYRNLRFIRELDLHLGYHSGEAFEKQACDDSLLHDFAAFFALVQGHVTDIHYRFYAQCSWRADNAIEKMLIAKIMAVILESPLISGIRAHIYTRDTLNEYEPEIMAGFFISLPHFSNTGHLYSLDIRQYADDSVLWPLLSSVAQLSQCIIEVRKYPRDLQALPATLRSLTLHIDEWSPFGIGSSLRLFLNLSTASPQLHHLRIEVAYEEYKTLPPSSLEAGLASRVPSFSINLTQLVTLDIKYDGVWHQFQICDVLAALNSPVLSSLSITGYWAWYGLHQLGTRVKSRFKSLHRVKLVEAVSSWQMEGPVYPWTESPVQWEVSQPLFEDLVQMLRKANIEVKVCMFTDRYDESLSPDTPSFQTVLSTLQNHLVTLDITLYEPDPEDIPYIWFERQYRLPSLQSLAVTCHIAGAIPFMARAYSAPQLRSINIVVSSGDVHRSAMIVGELTEVVRTQCFPQLRNITGEISDLKPERDTEGSESEAPEDDLRTTFRGKFIEQCRERDVMLEGLVWK